MILQNLGERYWRANYRGISTSWAGRSRWMARMSKNWRMGPEKLSPLRSIFPTNATKWFGGDEKSAVRCSMDEEFGRLFGMAHVHVCENSENFLGLQRE
jgi:hypothetical protein